MDNVLLIHPSRKVMGTEDIIYANEALVPSLGLASIAAYCKRNGIDSRVIDLRLKSESLENLFEDISRNKPLLAGITAFTNDMKHAGILCEKIKENFKELPLAVGGPHATILPEEMLRKNSAIDFCVRGEGEETFVELITQIKNGNGNNPGVLKNIKGLAFRSGQDIVVNEERPVIENIDGLPFPLWEKFRLKEYNDLLPVAMTRGCPFKCYFCTPNYLGKKVRVRDHKSIIEELKLIAEKFGISRVQFCDATMGLFKEQSGLLFEEMIKTGISKKIRWDCETRADIVSDSLVKTMKKAGCEWIALGVESGNKDILKDVIKKGESILDIIQAVKIIKRNKVKLRCFFTLGHYKETRKTIFQTIVFALRLNPDALSFGLIIPNPGTELRKIAETPGSGARVLSNNWENYQQFGYDCYELSDIRMGELQRWRSAAYFLFFALHPLKAFGLFFDKSSYNYNLKALIEIPVFLLKNLLGIKRA